MLALDVPEFEVAPGARVGVAGPSGSGKTSLLHLISGIERPTAGRVMWGDVDLAAMPEDARDRWRRQRIGLIFQEFHLFPGLSALANVLLPLRFDHFRLPAALVARATALLEEVGVASPHRSADVMSRGERQRIAIARALLRGPGILLADEPTANLDSESGAAVADLLVAQAAATGATLIVISHDQALLDRMEVSHRLVAGRFT
jgi:putative ABC transport system ATP-binding protein